MLAVNHHHQLQKDKYKKKEPEETRSSSSLSPFHGMENNFSNRLLTLGIVHEDHELFDADIEDERGGLCYSSAAIAPLKGGSNCNKSPPMIVIDSHNPPEDVSSIQRFQQQQQQQQPTFAIPASSADEIKSSTSNTASKLRTLEDLYKEGFITEDDFKSRKQQLIDEATGTKSILSSLTSTSSVSNTAEGLKMRSRRGSSRSFSPVVVPRPPPDFSKIPSERAIKIHFDLLTRTWSTKEITVRLDDTPFARGGLRLVYHISEESSGDEFSSPARSKKALLSSDYNNTPSRLELLTSSAYSSGGTPAIDDTTASTSFSTTFEDSSTASSTHLSYYPAHPNLKNSFCAKMAIDPNEDPSSYFRDVEMQAHCGYYAAKFNEYNPPRRIEFCKAWILELVERDGGPLVCVERFIAGPYRKHNNNFGFVSEDERNTPQAFSHFTYEASAHTLLVVDIQGVGDMYTDPQIHTLSGRDFGKGNLGRKGFEKFLKTHRCNSICRFLKLPPVNPKYNTDGTVPSLPYMRPARIQKERFEAGHVFERAPALQKYLGYNEYDLIDDQFQHYSSNGNQDPGDPFYWSDDERCCRGGFGCRLQ